MSTPINASTRAAYDQKVVEALKSEYKPGETVDIRKFHDKYLVKPQSIKRVIEAHPELDIHLPIRATTDPVVVK